MDDSVPLTFTCYSCNFYSKWLGNVPSCAYVHPFVDLSCNICSLRMHAPEEVVIHARSHGYAVDHLVEINRSRSPRESSTSNVSHVPASPSSAGDTSVFDASSFASSRVAVAEIHSPPRSVSSQLPSLSAPPLAQSTQMPRASPLIPVMVSQAQSPLSRMDPPPPRSDEIASLRGRLRRTTAHLVWLASTVARLPRFDTTLSVGMFVNGAHVAMTLPRQASDSAFRRQLVVDYPTTLPQAEQMSVIEIAMAMAPVYEDWQSEL